MTLSLAQYALGIFSGGLVGLILGLVGGGGSILALPLMVYLVGVSNPHLAIGTSALAVAGNALFALAHHARAGHVKWRCGGFYAAAGSLGALAGSSAGKAIDGHKLLFLFALVMIAVGILMLRRRAEAGDPGAQCNRENLPKVLGFGLGSGMFSGFFGIGGGFLIVPGLVASTGMPMLSAVGTSLIAVSAFGLTTAASYAVSGLVDPLLGLAFVAGGLVGSMMGTRCAKRLGAQGGRLVLLFAGLIFLVAGYMIVRSWNG